MELLALLSLIVYSILLLASLTRLLTGNGSRYNCKRRIRRRAGWLLFLLSLSRVAWSTSLLMGNGSPWQIVVSSVADALANASFYSWIASLALRALPRRTPGRPSQAGKHRSAIGICRSPACYSAGYASDVRK